MKRLQGCPFCAAAEASEVVNGRAPYVMGTDRATMLPMLFPSYHARETDALRKRMRKAMLRWKRGQNGVVLFQRSYYPGGMPLAQRSGHPRVYWYPVDGNQIPASQELADAVASTAQRYVGYFHGRVYRAAGHFETPGYYSTIVGEEDWIEPDIVADDCPFCQNLTDESVRRRLLGFMFAMAKELARINRAKYPDYPPLKGPDDYAFWEALEQWEAAHPEALRGYNLLKLPPHLQRALCIEWNHLWLNYLKANGMEYEST